MLGRACSQSVRVSAWQSASRLMGYARLQYKLVNGRGKPKDFLEYVVVHELVHLIEANYGNQWATNSLPCSNH